jgi:hypothetical protein
MNLDPDQKARLLDTAKHMAASWLQGLTPSESAALGGHSLGALERQLGSAFLEGFKAARMEESLSGAVSMLAPAPEPDLSDKTSKKVLVKMCRELGAPDEYILQHLGEKRRPKREEKRKVMLDILKARQDDGFEWMSFAKAAELLLEDPEDPKDPA